MRYLALVLLIVSCTASGTGFPESLRIMTWNLEVFNLRNTHPFHEGTPYGPRTNEELDELADRILDTGASIIALQEMNEMDAMHAFRDRLNAMPGSSGQWVVFPDTVSSSQQNALLYDETRVSATNAQHVFTTPSGGSYPVESFFRAPVTAVFSADHLPTRQFRVIGIHGSFQGAVIREQQGVWLNAYIGDLMASAGETDEIILIGDMNGAPVSGQAPHDGIVSSGQMLYVPKSNGESTAIGGAAIDHAYVSLAAEPFLVEPTTTVLREDFYGETPEDFRRIASDHYPVYFDFRLNEIFSKTPTGAILEEGDSHTFEVELSTPVGAVSYAWTKDGSPVGPDSGTFTIDPVAISDSGVYVCTVTDGSSKGVFVTTPVSLTVFAAGTLPASGYRGLGTLVVLLAGLVSWNLRRQVRAG